MKQFLCPACGGPVQFRSNILVFCTCPYCSQMIVRHDLELEAIGKMAMLSEGLTPLQIGTEGSWESKHFTLLGMLRNEWSNGFWNEWFALFDDQSHGWLAEAQGFYMMSFELMEASGEIPKSPSTLKTGQRIFLSKTFFEVEDIKEATCAGSQGTLPFCAPKGRKSTSIDLAGPGQAFACLDYSEEGLHTYVGNYAEFEELKLQNLRQLNGW